MNHLVSRRYNRAVLLLKRVLWRLSVKLLEGDMVINVFQNTLNENPGIKLMLKYGVLLRVGKIDELKLANEIIALRHQQKHRLEAIWSGKLVELAAFYKDFNFDSIPQRSNKTAVIVETRPVPYLETVIKNVMSKIGPEWALHVFYGPSNKELIQEIFKNNTTVNFTRLGEAISSKNAYNQMLKSSDFWQKINEEKILIFQTDCLIRKSNIDDFLAYDYIGPPWKFEELNSQNQVGNGGLSLRSKSVMIELSSKFQDSTLAEDVFFSKYCKKENYHIAPVKTAARFGAENVLFYQDPFGIHNPTLLSAKELATLLDFEP